MRTMLLSLGLAGLVLAPGCKKEKKADTADTDVNAEAPAPTGEAPGGEAAKEPPAQGGPAAGASAGDGEAPTMANKMAHCPSAVPGADTAVSEENGAVVLTVTAKEEAKVTEIQKRADHLDTIEAVPEAEIKHTGQGTGGGRSGKCPVVMTAVTLDVAKQKDGVKITLTPKDPATVGELAKTARERLSAMADGAGGGIADPGGADLSGEDEDPAGE